MALPLKPPIKPQLALSRKQLPEDEELGLRPKYDGFRALAFVDGDRRLPAVAKRAPLPRYFPELTSPPGRYVIDGELVILGADGREEFDALQNRLHPAESRVRMLAEKTPALFRAFDLLATRAEAALQSPFSERRDALEHNWSLGLEAAQAATGSVEVTPLVGVRHDVRGWLDPARA